MERAKDMDENESVEIRHTLWRLDCSREEMARLLDCPTYAERTPEVNASWEDYLGEMRYHYGYLLTCSHQFGPASQKLYENVLENWEHWNRPSELVRAEHLKEPAMELGRNRDGYADALY